MNKEELENRLKEINQSIDQVVANYNGLLGNKNEILHWLKRLHDEQENVVPSESAS